MTSVGGQVCKKHSNTVAGKACQNCCCVSFFQMSIINNTNIPTPKSRNSRSRIVDEYVKNNAVLEEFQFKIKAKYRIWR